MSSHTAQTELKLIGKLILEGDLDCQTGLHIGAGKGSLEIGGADNPVVKDAFGLPYIPGSSLRGKLRSMLEQATGMAVPSELVYLSKRKGQEVRIHQSDRPDDEICLLFGRSPGRMERVGGEALESLSASPSRGHRIRCSAGARKHYTPNARKPGRRAHRSEKRECH
jgi:CRISPR-associated protein Csm3